MIDTTTRRPLRVSTDGTAGPYIMVPVSQLDRVRRLLLDNKIPHRVDEDAISLGGNPAVVVIDLVRSDDAERTQAILDANA
ncbi:hypothetical protein [Singulisphaera acidiphila]|uniref:DUF2007 domain-containing protein n=1 Tax=Singulisphaera acidiphila (strain ATCC BAA-1392 / DSM 18658 / VKM B-2454 / MOB10) TaxID=886293 RepID=L0DHA8_SINAD|nr:hypothetical protein [Singulisphaera acidiphila]AGA28198.1 hypothetical protein Sinac_3973 [Singulisphaera acidiphila DSM 18658]